MTQQRKPADQVYQKGGEKEKVPLAKEDLEF